MTSEIEDAARAYVQAKRRVDNDVDAPGWTEAVWQQDAALHDLRVLLGEPCDADENQLAFGVLGDEGEH